MSDSLLTRLGYEDSAELRAAQEDADAHMDTIDTLVAVRTGRGLTQSEVARRMETTQSAVSHFERLGGDPRLSTLMRYARAVGARARVTVAIDGEGLEPIPAQVTSETSWDSEPDPSETIEGPWEPVDFRAELAVV